MLKDIESHDAFKHLRFMCVCVCQRDWVINCAAAINVTVSSRTAMENPGSNAALLSAG